MPVCEAKKIVDSWPPPEEGPVHANKVGSGYYGHDDSEGGCCYDPDGIIAVTFEGKGSEAVKLMAVTSGGEDDPNRAWSAATPHAETVMTINNPGAWGFFEVGQEYLVRFTKHQPAKARGGKGDNGPGDE